MKPNYPPENSRSGNSWKLVTLLLLFGCGLILFLSFLTKTDGPVQSSQSPTNTLRVSNLAESKNRPTFARRSISHEKQTAEEQVAARLVEFSKNRRAVTHRYAEKLGVAVPAELERFFNAADTGNWEEIDRVYKELETKTRTGASDEERMVLQKLHHTAKEVWGAHETAQSWPAQALLDYGRDVLGSLKPGMVYLGGTDPGRFIPTLLNETSGGQNIVLTQNAFADASYLGYVEFLYGDRLQTLSDQDAQKAFSGYIEDAAKRYAHDKEFPDEPKQMRPGENYKSDDGRVQVSGPVAVMAINEFMVKMLQEKNPELAFAMEESFSLPSTYDGAVPLGPLVQLGSVNAPSQLTPALAAGSIDYWRDRVSQLTSSPEFDPTRDTERTYAHMIVAQGNLFSSQNLSAEAEQAFRLAQQLASNEVEPVGKLYGLLMRTGRAAEAANMLNEFQQANPDKADAIQALRQ